MRNGFKVYDSDTHITASAEDLEPYLASAIKELLPDLDALKVPVRANATGETLEPPYSHRFRLAGTGAGWMADVPRILGEAAPQENAERQHQKFMGTKWPSKDGEWVAVSRIRDMDEERVDVQVTVPGVPRGHSDPAVDMEFMRANHRFLADFCGPYPDRLKALLILDARFIEESVQEIKTWGSSRWAVGAWINLPLDFPMDHPDLNPVWAAIEEEGLCVVHHSFSSGYPAIETCGATLSWVERPLIPGAPCGPWPPSSDRASWTDTPPFASPIWNPASGGCPSGRLGCRTRWSTWDMYPSYDTPWPST